MNGLFTADQLRIIAASVCSYLLAYVTPTGGFILALVLFAGFNIWCGMRADGVSVQSCKNFKWSKFRTAIGELLLCVFLVLLLSVSMGAMGDETESVVVIKSMTYVFCYIYLQNSVKNLIIAYPRNVKLRVMYHLIRFEFTRAMPSHVKGIVERLEDEIESRQTSKLKANKN